MHCEQSTQAKAPKRLTIGSLTRAVRQFLRTVFVRGFYYSQMSRVARRLARRYSFAGSSGSARLKLQRHPESKFAILCYHRVGTAGVPLYSQLHEKAFAAQMRHLAANYRVVPLNQLYRELEEGCQVSPTVAVTFDDGYRDLYTFALPVLQRYSIPATVYLIGHCMDTGEAPWYDRVFVQMESAPLQFEVALHSPRVFRLPLREDRLAAAWEIVSFLKTIPDASRRAWCTELQRRLPANEAVLAKRMLDWEQVREMSRHGIRFGAHTMTHPAVSQLHPSQMPEELLHSKRLLERGLDGPVDDFAYPFGKLEDFSSVAQEFLARNGYRSAVTTVDGYNSRGANPFELRRVQIGGGRSLAGFSFELSRIFLGSHAEKHSLVVPNVAPEHPFSPGQGETQEGVRQENA